MLYDFIVDNLTDFVCLWRWSNWYFLRKKPNHPFNLFFFSVTSFGNLMREGRPFSHGNLHGDFFFQVVSVLNPNCPAAYHCNSSVAHLFYVRADSTNDSLHYFWSFSGKPTMTLALTSLDTQASISWPIFSNQSFNSNGTIQFNKAPLYVFGVVMNQVRIVCHCIYHICKIFTILPSLQITNPLIL